MSKVMLIMDMPSCCVKCPVVNELGSIYICGDNGKVIENGYAVQRAEWCPLREVPQKKEVSKYDGYCMNMACTERNRGYNSCIDKILGGGK